MLLPADRASPTRPPVIRHRNSSARWRCRSPARSPWSPTLPAMTWTLTPPGSAGPRYLRRIEFLVARRSHLVGGRQVDPELEAPHQAVFLFRHFGMDDAAAGGHPLHAARPEQALMAFVVAMAHAGRRAYRSRSRSRDADDRENRRCSRRRPRSGIRRIAGRGIELAEPCDCRSRD